jgi:hypothetical protein
MGAETELLKSFGARARVAGLRAHAGATAPLIGPGDLEEFARAASRVLAETENGEVLGRAVALAVQTDQAPLEVAFIGLFAALESVLTFSRRREDFDILAPAEFVRLEKDLRAWLRQQPALESDAEKRALIYEKARELNRFPFSRVFGNFCARHAVDLSGLWPLLGRREEWPLLEIRHRLVHGDPFRLRPAEALACARQHLSWTVERMLLAALGWPVARSGASGHGLEAAGPLYTDWPAARSQLA